MTDKLLITEHSYKQNPSIQATVRTYIYSHTDIKNVPGGKVNILGGHTMGHSEQKLYMYMCPIPKGFRDRSMSLYSSKIVMEEILRTVSNTDIYCSSDKVGTVYPVQHISQNSTVNINTLRNSCE
jgi:hypothetical protein